MAISKRKILFRGLLFLLPLSVLVAGVLPAFAFQDETLHKEVPLVLNKSYDVFIGNGGVYLDNSQMVGTLVLKSEYFPASRWQSWWQFTQRILDVSAYDQAGKPYGTVYGLVRVYFNLDKTQYDKWIAEDSNMSIWYFEQPVGGWHKCVTHWEAVAGLPKGRLWCLAHQYTRYGLAYTQPTLLMKMIKGGTITVTPTPTLSPTPP